MLACCFALLLGHQGPLVDPDAPVEYRWYDVSALTGVGGFRSDVLAMLPYQWNTYTEDIVLEDEWDRLVTRDDLLVLVRETVFPEHWDSDLGWTIDLTGSHRLLASVPPVVHREIERLLAFLHQALVPTERLEVRVFSGDVPADLPLLVPAQAIESHAQSLREVRSGSVTLLQGIVRRIESVDVENLPFDWELEIAEQSVAGQPVLLSVAEGLTAVVRGAPAQGGTFLDLLLRQSTRIGDGPTTGALPSTGTVVLDSQTQLLSSPRTTGSVEHPSMAFACFAGRVLLPAGMAVLLPVRLDTQSGQVRYLIALSVSGALRGNRQRYAFDWVSMDPDWPAQRTVVDLLYLDASGGVEHPSLPNYLFDVDPSMVWEPSTVTASLSRTVRDRHLLMDMLYNAQTDAYESDARNRISELGDVLLLRGSPEVVDRASAFVQSVSKPAALVTVLGSLERESVAGTRGQLPFKGEVGRFRLPALLGQPVTFWCGVESMALSSWNPDVANRAMAHSPEFNALVDGLALVLSVHELPQGGLQLRVNGKVNLLTEVREGPLESTRLVYTKAKSRALAIEDELLIPAEGGSVTLGGIGLELELTISR